MYKQNVNNNFMSFKGTLHSSGNELKGAFIEQIFCWLMLACVDPLNMQVCLCFLARELDWKIGDIRTRTSSPEVQGWLASRVEVTLLSGARHIGCF